MQSDDVRELQSEPLQMDHNIDADELSEQLFGPETGSAMRLTQSIQTDLEEMQ